VVKPNWFSRPGIASTLTPSAGIVQAWITSDEVTRSRISVFIGTTSRLSTSNIRNSPRFSMFLGTINES